MPKKINWDSVRQDFLESENLTYTALATRHGLSRQSIEKRAADEGWQALRQALRRKQAMIIEEAEQTDEFNLDALLKKAIALSFSQLQSAEVRNFEGAAESFCKLAETYFKLNPPAPSIERWADVVVEYDLSFEEILKRVKDHVLSPK